MPSAIASQRLDSVLRRLFAAAALDDEIDEPAPPPGVTSWSQAASADRSNAFEDYYLPISAQAGNLLYALTRAIRPDTVIEFGTSYGISTLYLAAAVADNGVGHIITTELSTKKAAAAHANLEQAGVADRVTIMTGDALETLADVPGPISLVLLDGWKNLCLPVLRMLESKLRPGALIAADDTTLDSMASYLSYVRDPANGYVTIAFPVEDGIELSSWVSG